MWAVLGTLVDFVHALAMAAWVLGLPLLFWHRWPRASVGFAIYAIVFLVLNQVSMWTLNECFLTTIARWCWEHVPEATGARSREWFTVRVAKAIFGLTPSHDLIKIVSKVLMLTTASGVLVSSHRWQRQIRTRRRA